MDDKTVVINFGRDEAENLVWEQFLKSSGLLDEEKASRLSKIAQKYKALADDNVNLRAAIKQIDDFKFEKGRLKINSIDYGDFEIGEKDTEQILGLYAYVVCAGKFETDIDPICDAFVDLWGNAYCGTAHILLRERLSQFSNSGQLISPPFGPGFFGMGFGNLKSILELVDASVIDVQLKEQYMLPLKSCAGFFIASAKPLDLPSKDCSSCVGNRGNCNYCRGFKA